MSDGSQGVGRNGGGEEEEQLERRGVNGVTFMIVGASERLGDLMLAQRRLDESLAPRIVLLPRLTR